jgi:hypothetical protein
METGFDPLAKAGVGDLVALEREPVQLALA